MKKMIMTIAAVLTLSVANAANSNVASENNLMMDVNMNSLRRTLSLNNDQENDIVTVHRIYNQKIERAQKIENDAKKLKAVRRAMNFNIANMRAVLSEYQYRKYLQILNATLKNRGLDIR